MSPPLIQSKTAIRLREAKIQPKQLQVNLYFVDKHAIIRVSVRFRARFVMLAAWNLSLRASLIFVWGRWPVGAFMGEHSITFEEHAKDEDVRRISEGLGKYNLEQTGRDDFRKLNVFVRDNDDEIIGGVIGGTYWGWLYVDLLWIDERVRHLGYGRKLLEAAEEEAIKRGCTQVFLDTFSFQARPFYEKHGYIVFGTLKDFPPGHERYFLQKTLSEDLSQDAFI